MVIIKASRRLTIAEAERIRNYYDNAVSRGGPLILDQAFDVIEVNGRDLKLYLGQLGDA